MIREVRRRTDQPFNVLHPVPATTGDWEEMPWLAGQGVGLVTEIRPAGQIVEGMMREAASVLAGFQPRLQ